MLFHKMRRFSVAPPTGSVADQRALKFIEKNPLLKQVFIRQPDDNLFPKFKSALEFT